MGCEDVAAFDRLVTRRRIDLALLDITMPGEDGLSLRRRLRARGDTAILMLMVGGRLILADRESGCRKRAAQSPRILSPSSGSRRFFLRPAARQPHTKGQGGKGRA